MTTLILSNGSRWAGEEPASVAELLDVLKTHPLDRMFEDYGNFVEQLPNGMTSYFGNFHTLSHVFSIKTDDPAIIAPLTAAVRANQLRADYLAQPTPAEINAKREKWRAEQDAKRQADREQAARIVLGLEP